MLDFVLSHREKFEKVFTSKSHAIMLESEDQVLTSNLAKLFAMNLSCKSSEKPCKICSSCLKIIDNNSLDTFVYPTKDVILMDDVNDILQNISIVPAENEYKVFILQNFDEASLIVQNKLLKTIEEPPRFVKFVLTAKSKNKVAQTICSRCEVISLPKFSNEELKSLVSYLSPDMAQVVIENSNGSISLLQKIKLENNFIENYNFALNVLLNLENSKQILNFSSKLSKDKENFLEILDLIYNFLFDVIKINEGQENLVQNKYCLYQLQKISQKYSQKACLNIQEKIVVIKDKIKFNGNLSIIVDDFMLNILEEKWKNKK